MKGSPKSSRFRYPLTMNNTLYSQFINFDPKQKRNDVALKSGIRAIRRHIKNKFKTQNTRLVQRRFENVKNFELIKQVLKMVSAGNISETIFKTWLNI